MASRHLPGTRGSDLRSAQQGARVPMQSKQASVLPSAYMQCRSPAFFFASARNVMYTVAMYEIRRDHAFSDRRTDKTDREPMKDWAFRKLFAGLPVFKVLFEDTEVEKRFFEV